MEVGEIKMKKYNDDDRKRTQAIDIGERGQCTARHAHTDLDDELSKDWREYEQLASVIHAHCGASSVPRACLRGSSQGS